MPGLHDTSNKRELDDTGTTTPDTSSIKYGLTYSVSEIITVIRSS